MNVPFILSDSALDQAFLAEADTAGLRNLKGHRSVGGMRASIYNAVPETAVDALMRLHGGLRKTQRIRLVRAHSPAVARPGGT